MGRQKKSDYHQARLQREDYKLAKACSLREGIRLAQFYHEAINARAIGARTPTPRQRELREAREHRRRVSLILADQHARVVECCLWLSSNAAEHPTGGDHAPSRELLLEILNDQKDLMRYLAQSDQGMEQ